jgi:hypothetical protein
MNGGRRRVAYTRPPLPNHRVSLAAALGPCRSLICQARLSTQSAGQEQHSPLTCSRQHSPLISSRSSTRIAILNWSAAVNRTTDWRRYARHRHRAPLVGVASWVLAAGGLAVVFRLRPRVWNRVRALLPRGRRRAVRAGCRASPADINAAEVDERCKREPTTVPDA